MNKTPENQQKDQKRPTWHTVPRQGSFLVIMMVLLSFLLHIGSYVPLNFYTAAFNLKPRRQEPVKISVHYKEPTEDVADAKKAEEEKKNDPDLKKIIETPLQETMPPKETKYLGVTDHATEKETKIADQKVRPKAADAGNKGIPEAAKQGEKLDSPDKPNKPTDKTEQLVKAEPVPKDAAVMVPKDAAGRLEFPTEHKPRNKYEALLPGSKELFGQVNAGYQDYIDDKMDEADRIDINTAEYRYISYFTKMRKAIELVWIYPMDAVRKGIYGDVVLEWIIAKDGSVHRIRVLKSSGYDVLDNAIVKAVKEASPFPSLPTKWGVQRKVISGTFRYVLSNIAGSH